jgi:hypothetical protein
MLSGASLEIPSKELMSFIPSKTLARASNYLDSLKIADLHQLERHYADH